MGMTPKYKTPEAMQKAIDAYFVQCDEEKKPYTVTGLALALDFADKKSLRDYQEKDEFSPLIKRAKLKVEMAYERRLSGANATGAIFALKNMGWRDQQHYEHGGSDLIAAIKRVGERDPPS